MNYDEPIAFLRVNKLGKHTIMSAQELWKEFVPLYCPAQVELMIEKALRNEI